MAHRRTKSPERLTCRGSLGRGVVDAAHRERVDHCAGPEKVLDGEPRAVGIRPAAGDHGDARALGSPMLLGQHGLTDR